MSLVAHFGCQDNAANTTVTDLFGGNNGTAARNTNTAFSATCSGGVLGRAFVFNGTTDKVTFASDWLPTGDLSISCWLFITGNNTDYGRLFDDGKLIVTLDVAGQVFGVRSDGSTAVTSTAGSCVLSTWLHLVITRTSTGTVAFYVNNVAKGSGASGTPATGTDLTMGNRAAGDRSMTSYLTDMRVYDHILTSDEITALYDNCGGEEILVSDSNMVLSPYNWYVNGSSYCQSNTPGSYVKLATDGIALAVVVDVAAMRAQAFDGYYYPQLQYSVNNGPWAALVQPSSAADHTTIVFGRNLTAVSPNQLLVIFKTMDSSTVGANIWTNPNFYLRFLRFLTSPGAASVPTTGSLARKTKNIMVIGDSLTRGTGALAAGDPIVGESAIEAIPWFLGQAYDAEVGGLGYGSAGEAVGAVGQCGVPAAWVADGSGSWSNYFAGQSRLVGGKLSPEPDMIFDVYGTADYTNSRSDANVEAGLLGLLPALRVGAPNAWIVRAIPPGGWKRTPITTGFAAYQLATPDGRCILVDCGTSIEDGVDDQGASRQSGDGIHPYGRVYAEFVSRVVELVHALPDADTSVSAILDLFRVPAYQPTVGSDGKAAASLDATERANIAGAVLDEAKGTHTGHLATAFATETKQDTAKSVLDTVAVDVAGLDGAAMRGTDGAYTGTPPTAEQNADQVRTELTTELARLDVAVGTRHAAGAAVAKSPATLDWSADVTNPPTIGTSTLAAGAKMDLVDAPSATAVASIKANLGTVPASGNWNTVTPPTVAEIAAGIMDLAAAIDGKTPRETLRVMAAILAGKVSGAGTGTETFKGLDGTTTRAVVTVDASGNRSGVTYP